MRFAAITSLNWGYKYGLNGIINGLDYHGHTLVDVYYIYDTDVPEWYRLKAADTFDFKVEGYAVAEYQAKYPPLAISARWHLVYYNYKLAMDLADEYDAVVILDADTMIVGNIESYLRAVAATDLVMLPNFAGTPGSHINESDPDRWRHHVGKSHDFTVNLNSPVMLNPSRNKELIDAVWAHGKVTHSPYRAMLWALIDQDRLHDVIVLPNLFWVNPLYTSLSYRYAKTNGRRSFFVHGDKVMMVHRRWWELHEMREPIDHYPRALEDRELALRNMDYFVTECKLINTTWKLALDWDADR